MNDVSAAQRPLCFVLMPFGTKKDHGGAEIDFDEVYGRIIRPAVLEAALEPLRADEERDGGIIHKPMFERLLLCSYAVADLTLANANVFYELGVRHAVRPHTTILLYNPDAQELPFDVQPLRALRYRVEAGLPVDEEAVRTTLVQRLVQARSPAPDSPLVTLLEDYTPPRLDGLRSSAFRDRVHYAEERKRDLAAARASKDPSAVDAVRDALGPLEDAEAGVLLDLMASYRSMDAWDQMLELVGRMPAVLRETPLVCQQQAFALNRLDRWQEAIDTLEGLVRRVGASSETLGLLGRVYKDLWRQAVKGGDEVRAAGLLDRAIEAYRRGFDADWRDVYPGINLLTLIAVRDPEDAEIHDLLAVVRFAHRRQPDTGYWLAAVGLELAVIEEDATTARGALERLLTESADGWQLRTTAENLELHVAARARHGQNVSWVQVIVDSLRAAATGRLTQSVAPGT